MTERISDLDLVARRSFNARAGLLFKAWTTPDLMKRWWVPESFGITLLSADMDAREGGRYRFVFAHPAAEAPVEFVGRYLEVVPDARLVWTNEESEDGAVTLVTFTERNGWTEVVIRDHYPTKAALDAAIESGEAGAYDEQLAELDRLVPTFTD